MRTNNVEQAFIKGIPKLKDLNKPPKRTLRKI